MNIKEPSKEVDWVGASPVCKYLYQRLIKVRNGNEITIEEVKEKEDKE